MIPRTCDDDRCDYDQAGWVHDPACATQKGRPVVHLDRETGQDWRDATDMEDGCYGRRPSAPAQQETRTAA